MASAVAKDGGLGGYGSAFECSTTGWRSPGALGVFRIVFRVSEKGNGGRSKYSVSVRLAEDLGIMLYSACGPGDRRSSHAPNRGTRGGGGEQAERWDNLIRCQLNESRRMATGADLLGWGSEAPTEISPDYHILYPPHLRLRDTRQSMPPPIGKVCRHDPGSRQPVPCGSV